MVSLVRYLDPVKNTICLRPSLTSNDPDVIEKTPFPFEVISESDPLARLIKARFITDAGSEVKRVFLLMQKDHYHLTEDSLRPLNNKDIGDYWQKAFSFYSQADGGCSCITLSHQISPHGRLQSFNSLFFCKRRQLFFHPPCPECGHLLEQCTDDDLLAYYSLKPFSSSLRRYLYCPSCVKSNSTSLFFVYESESSDSPLCKQRLDLIKAFDRLLGWNIPPEQFPCVDCPHSGECFGAGDAATTRIVPFSFYPFYMLILEEMSLHALDFLSLIAGASVEEVERHLHLKGERGRSYCLRQLRADLGDVHPFFFIKDERYFLEVLYLKLSFLSKVIQCVFRTAPKEDKHPGLRLSLDRMWIKLTDNDSLLPFFWNFSVTSIDLMKERSLHAFSFLAHLWFYTLLVNGKQDMRAVNASLKEGMKDFPVKLFPPETIFWNWEGKSIPEKWESLWEKSLELGWRLLKSSSHADSQWSFEEFCQELEALREEVKKSLFQTKKEPERRAYFPEKEAIYHILEKILTKWRKEHIPLKGEPVEDELAETVMIPSAVSPPKPEASSLRKEGHEPGDYLTKQGESQKDELAETVVLPSAGSPPKPEASSLRKEGHEPGDYLTKQGESQKDELAETVVLPSAGPPPEPKEAPVKKERIEDDFYTETVILTPDMLKKIIKKREEEK